MSEQTNERTNKRTNEQTNEQTNKHTNKQARAYKQTKTQRTHGKHTTKVEQSSAQETIGLRKRSQGDGINASRTIAKTR